MSLHSCQRVSDIADRPLITAALERIRLESILVVDFPISLMDCNVLSSKFMRPGYQSAMLGSRDLNDHDYEWFTNDSLCASHFSSSMRSRCNLGWLAEFCGHAHPSRSVLVLNCMASAQILRKYELFGALRSYMHGIVPSNVLITRFFDIRDALEFVSCMTSSNSNAVDDGVFFLDESIMPVLYELGWTEDRIGPVCLSPTNLGVLCVMLRLPPGTHSGISEACEALVDSLSSHGSLLAYSDIWKEQVGESKSIKVKLFVEYDDCRQAEMACAKLQKTHCRELNATFCCLHQKDKEYLFNQNHDDAPPTPTSLPSASRVIRRPSHSTTFQDFPRHIRTLSTVSISFSSITALSESDNESPNAKSQRGASEKAVKLGNEVDLTRIEQGMDKRTTCMIKNIPNKYTQQMLIDHLDESHAARYDFVYLRMDFKNKCNVGYAFINFLSPTDIISYTIRMVGKRWPRFNSEKRCELAYARIQGKSALIDKFRNSRVMQEPPSYRPRVFDRS